MKSGNRAPRLILALGMFAFAVSAPPLLFAAGPRDAKSLIDALEDQGIDAVSALVRGGADINARKSGDGTVLMVASKRGDLVAVDRLLALGADVNVSATGDGTALIAASGAGHLPVIKRLLSAGARIDAAPPGDETALIAASRKGHLDVVRYLVASKADVNLGVTTPAGIWRTPLNQAGTPAIRDFLLENGARTTRK